MDAVASPNGRPTGVPPAVLRKASSGSFDNIISGLDSPVLKSAPRTPVLSPKVSPAFASVQRPTISIASSSGSLLPTAQPFVDAAEPAPASPSKRRSPRVRDGSFRTRRSTSRRGRRRQQQQQAGADSAKLDNTEFLSADDVATLLSHFTDFGDNDDEREALAEALVGETEDGLISPMALAKAILEPGSETNKRLAADLRQDQMLALQTALQKASQSGRLSRQASKRSTSSRACSRAGSRANSRAGSRANSFRRTSRHSSMRRPERGGSSSNDPTLSALKAANEQLRLALQTSNELAQTNIDELEAAVEELETELKAANVRNRALAADNSRLGSEKDCLRQDLDATKAELAQRQASTAGDSELHTRLRGLEKEVQQLVELKTAAEDEARRLGQELAAAHHEAVRCTAAADAAQAEATEARERIAALQDDLKAMRSVGEENAYLKQANQELSSQLGELQKQQQNRAITFISVSAEQAREATAIKEAPVAVAAPPPRLDSAASSCEDASAGLQQDVIPAPAMHVAVRRNAPSDAAAAVAAATPFPAAVAPLNNTNSAPANIDEFAELWETVIVQASEIDQLRADLAVGGDMLDDALARAARLEGELANARQQRPTNKDETKKDEEEVTQAVEAMRKRAEQEAAVAAATISGLEAKVATLEGEIERRRKVQSQQAQLIEKLESPMAEMKQSFERLKTKSVALDQQVRHCQEQIVQKDKAIERLEKTFQAHSETGTALQEVNRLLKALACTAENPSEQVYLDCLVQMRELVELQDFQMISNSHALNVAESQIINERNRGRYLKLANIGLEKDKAALRTLEQLLEAPKDTADDAAARHEVELARLEDTHTTRLAELQLGIVGLEELCAEKDRRIFDKDQLIGQLTATLSKLEALPRPPPRRRSTMVAAGDARRRSTLVSSGAPAAAGSARSSFTAASLRRVEDDAAYSPQQQQKQQRVEPRPLSAPRQQPRRSLFSEQLARDSRHLTESLVTEMDLYRTASVIAREQPRTWEDILGDRTLSMRTASQFDSRTMSERTAGGSGKKRWGASFRGRKSNGGDERKGSADSAVMAGFADDAADKKKRKGKFGSSLRRGLGSLRGKPTASEAAFEKQMEAAARAAQEPQLGDAEVDGAQWGEWDDSGLV